MINSNRKKMIKKRGLSQFFYKQKRQDHRGGEVWNNLFIFQVKQMRSW